MPLRGILSSAPTGYLLSKEGFQRCRLSATIFYIRLRRSIIRPRRDTFLQRKAISERALRDFLICGGGASAFLQSLQQKSSHCKRRKDTVRPSPATQSLQQKSSHCKRRKDTVRPSPAPQSWPQKSSHCKRRKGTVRLGCASQYSISDGRKFHDGNAAKMQYESSPAPQYAFSL